MTGKQQKALAALITYPTREKAAEAAGITSKTLRTYLEDDEFREAYEKAFAGLVETATRQAQQSLTPALFTLRSIAQDKNQSASARIQAARTLLEYGLRLTEKTDIIRALEGAEGDVL